MEGWAPERRPYEQPGRPSVKRESPWVRKPRTPWVHAQGMVGGPRSQSEQPSRGISGQRSELRRGHRRWEVGMYSPKVMYGPHQATEPGEYGNLFSGWVPARQQGISMVWVGNKRVGQHFKILEEKAGTYKKGTNTFIWITEVFIVLCLGCFSAWLGVPPQNKIFILSVMQCLLSAPCMLCWTLKIIANEAGLPRVPPIVKIQINESCLQCSMICSAKRHTECFSENTGVAPNPVSHADIWRITRANQI